MFLSDALGVPATKLIKLEVYDFFVGVDALFHVDPARLRTTTVPELAGRYSEFHEYFAMVLKMVMGSSSGDLLERQAVKMLCFPEVKQAGLGYAKESVSGRGVTLNVADKLFKSAKQIISAGVKDPAIFELAVLFEDGFGPDLISDMTIYIMIESLNLFNKRIARELNLEIRSVPVEGKTAYCVVGGLTNRGYFLIPSSLLSDLPLAKDWDEIDKVSDYNDRFRLRINKLVQEIWGKEVKRPNKNQIKEVLIKNPALFQSIIERYLEADAPPHDFSNDPRLFEVWKNIAREFSKANPCAMALNAGAEGLVECISIICAQFKYLLEDKGLCEVVHEKSGEHRNEKIFQLLFYAIADSYCAANGIDITSEPATGRGPVDFKLKGAGTEKVLVEIKLSTNKKAVDGLEMQLPTYMKSEKATHGIYILILVGDNSAAEKTLRQVSSKFDEQRKDNIRLEVIDARKKLSASKLSSKHTTQNFKDF